MTSFYFILYRNPIHHLYSLLHLIHYQILSITFINYYILSIVYSSFSYPKKGQNGSSGWWGLVYYTNGRRRGPAPFGFLSSATAGAVTMDIRITYA